MVSGILRGGRWPRAEVRETVRDHLFEVGVASACLALAYVRDHFPDLDHLPVVDASFKGTWMTTENSVSGLIHFCVPFVPIFGPSDLTLSEVFLGPRRNIVGLSGTSPRAL